THYEGLGLGVAQAALRTGRSDGEESLLARPVRELQDHVSVPGGELRAGRRRARRIHRSRVPDVHSGCPAGRRGAASYQRRLRSSRRGAGNRLAMKEQIARSVFWLAWSRGVVQAISLLSTVAVARLLSPR